VYRQKADPPALTEKFNPNRNLSYWVKCDTFFAAHGKKRQVHNSFPDPKLGPLVNNGGPMALFAGSPAIATLWQR
jgi:hypothetical protein